MKCIDSFPCPLLLSIPLDNGVVARKVGCPLSATYSNICSAMLSQAPCGLFSAEYRFFSEPGPINDHCPIPISLCKYFDDSGICQTFFFLAFLTQEMSLNIDINRILPVKDSGVCHIGLRRSLILSQSCNDVNPLEFRRLSVDCIIISVAFLGSDSCNPVLPSFVGIWMLKDPPEAQNRI